MAKYVLTKQADLDIEEIFIYTANRWDLIQAEKYLSELDTYMQKIAGRVIVGKSCENLIPNGKNLQYYHANSHYIIYRILEKTTEIIALYHDKMDLEYHLSQL